jgi:hypothetical protein
MNHSDAGGLSTVIALAASELPKNAFRVGSGLGCGGEGVRVTAG